MNKKEICEARRVYSIQIWGVMASLYPRVLITKIFQRALAQRSLSVRSAFAQRSLSVRSAFAQRSLSVRSAFAQRSLSASSAQAQRKLSASSAQAQRKLSASSALVNPGLRYCHHYCRKGCDFPYVPYVAIRSHT
jgi:hypothetical protein